MMLVTSSAYVVILGEAPPRSTLRGTSLASKLSSSPSTAFLAFGGRVMFSEMGQYQILFWIAPGIIGGSAISLLVRKYKGTKTNP